ncbi:MAG: S8 family serine peptidase [Chitinophagaceae bacterium]
MKKILLFVSFFIAMQAHSQSLHMKTGEFVPEKNMGQIDFFNQWDLFQYNAKTYCIIQFEENPSLQDRNVIEQQTGIQFLYYIPENAYMSAVPSAYDINQMTAFGVRSVIPYVSTFKIDVPVLERPLPAYAINGEKMKLVLTIQRNLTQAEAEMLFESKEISFLGWKNKYNAFVEINENKIDPIAQLAWVNYLQLISAPTVYENLEGRSSHRTNVLSSAYTTGLHFDGAGVSVAEGDDGGIGPHIDFKGRLFNHSSGMGGTHGDHVGGIVAGAGNFDPIAAGNATGADLHVYNNYQNLTQAPTAYTTDGVRITTNSLGQGCNSGYDSDAEDADILIKSKFSLMSVHSSGNSGNTSCGGVGGGFYTITGGYKSGKNVLAVGNLLKDDALANSSSRGPAADGRIKPDICAVGTNVNSTQPDNTYDVFTGTSMACPGVAGSLATLWQAYRTLHFNQDPPSYLMKGVVLNSADDLGNPGPDFKYGFGRINVRKAYTILKNNQYIIDSVNQGNNKNYSLVVPPGTKQVKVMVYWNDVEGAPGNSVVLVNNINMRLLDPTFNIYNPWVLDHTANTTALNSLPTRQKDNLNNVEQVTLEGAECVPGNYTINIKGQTIPFGPQPYVICWEFLSDSLVLTYPQGGESFARNKVERVRWEAYENTTPFTLEYSSDAGSTWNTLSSNIPADTRYYDWTPPATLGTGKMLMKISRGTMSDVSDTLFTVHGVPQNLVVDTACENIFHLNWDPVTGANKYMVYMLGAKYMEIIDSSLTDEILLSTGINMIDTFYFAVAAVDTTNGALGRRSIAYCKLPGEINCLDDLTDFETILPFDTKYNCAVSSTLPISMKIANIGPRDISNIPVGYRIDANPVVTEMIPGTLLIGDTLTYTFTTLGNFSGVGTHNVTTWVSKYSDINKLNDTSSKSLQTLLPVNLVAPFVEDFESPTYPPNGWTVIDPDASVKWQKTLCFNGATSGNTYAAYMDFFNYTTIGQIDDLESGHIDLTNATTDSVILNFDLAAASRATESDSLMVLISNDCGQTFVQSSFKKWGSNLATVPPMTTIFSPTLTNQWRRERIDLSAYKGQKVFVRFRGVNFHGNNIYIDNINVDLKDAWAVGVHNIDESIVRVYPNPSNGLYTLDLSAVNDRNLTYRISSISGQVIEEKSIDKLKNQSFQIDIRNQANGIYIIEFKGEVVHQQMKLIKR